MNDREMKNAMRNLEIEESIRRGAKREDLERVESIITKVHPMVAEAVQAEIEKFVGIFQRCASKEERLTVLEIVELWAKIQGDMMRQPKKEAVDIEVK